MAAMAGRLAGKICLITGGTCGIGLAAARRFVEEGAKVVVTGRNHNRMEQAVAELGAEAVGIACDSTKSADLDRLYEDIRERFGRIDVLFVCAGSGTFAELGTISEEFVDSIFDLNVKSVIFTVQKALPLLSDGASIVLTGSVVGSHGAFRLSASMAPARRQCAHWRAAGPWIFGRGKSASMSSAPGRRKRRDCLNWQVATTTATARKNWPRPFHWVVWVRRRNVPTPCSSWLPMKQVS